MEISEKFLVSLCGWPVFQEARRLHAAGRVSEASYVPPVLKARVTSDGKPFLAGLKIKNAIDIENLCPCRDSRARGIICAHAVAAGLEFLKPTVPVAAGDAAPKPAVPSPGAATSEAPEVRLRLEGSLRHLEAEVSFFYQQPGVSNAGAELAVLKELMDLGFEDRKGKAVLEGEDAVVGFFANRLPGLRTRWQVEEGERFQHVTRDIARIEPQFAIREKGDGWLDFHVHFTAGRSAVFTAQEMQRLLRSGKPVTRLADGKMAVADPGLAADLEEVLRDCDPRQERGAYRIRDVHRGYLEACLHDWGAKPVPESAQTPPLGPVASRLRSYQLEGAQWMLSRAIRGEGGLLADEMGLGKTIQALAMMEALPGRPHLVVCPSSLVWNWHREAEHFLPDRKILSLEGTGRAAAFSRIPEHDVVITSYALLRRDIAAYKDTAFATVTLDEAQHVKNPDSQNAKAAAGLCGGARFILTGTPLENSLRDLWSLFEFLLPGYLGTRRDFQERYEKPLLEGAKGAVWERLLRRVRPWMLRRRKADVLADLPDKIEQIVEVDLSPAQKAAYTELQIAARAGIDALKSEGGGGARMKVLTALLRLRQVCCDVRLLGAEATGPSGKLETLLEILREAIDGGHRVLVFSQFTSMLDLIEPALSEAGMASCRLDGSTKDRAAVVERFQTDDTIPVFLISLKAGGSGLNLTAADTVIHFDPWWNPAAEAQATDRAHRIGQKNVVTSIKLVARDTVEGRVIELQKRKRDLLGGLLDGDEAASRMTTDDLAELIG